MHYTGHYTGHYTVHYTSGLGPPGARIGPLRLVPCGGLVAHMSAWAAAGLIHDEALRRIAGEAAVAHADGVDASVLTCAAGELEYDDERVGSVAERYMTEADFHDELRPPPDAVHPPWPPRRPPAEDEPEDAGALAGGGGAEPGAAAERLRKVR